MSIPSSVMKPKYLSILLIIATLVLGVVLGAVGNGALNNKRMKEISKIRRPGGFTEFVMRSAQPENDAQRAAIESVLKDFGQQFRELGGKHQEEMRALGDSLMANLGGVLSDEQLEAVEEAMSTRRRRFEDGSPRRNRRPPPDARPRNGN